MATLLDNVVAESLSSELTMTWSSLADPLIDSCSSPLGRAGRGERELRFVWVCGRWGWFGQERWRGVEECLDVVEAGHGGGASLLEGLVAGAFTGPAPHGDRSEAVLERLGGA